jgi:hypothetical protein
MDKTIHVPVDLHEALKVKAAQQRVTLAVLVERVLRAVVVDPPRESRESFERDRFGQTGDDIRERNHREYVYDDSDSQVRRR